jgi:predicted dehydrogenase
MNDSTRQIEILTRRRFSRASALATALSCSRIRGANDRVGVGYIGLGNRGDQVHDAFLEWSDAETVAVCDLREDYMDFAVKKSRARPVKYQDYRKLLEDKNVTAVVIATPDHWHALMFIEACLACKDVYVEKPLSLTVVEGRKMVEVARRTNRITQVRTNRRSWRTYSEAAELVQSGGLGKVTLARCFHLRNEWPIGLGAVPLNPPPTKGQWDRWLGPAPYVPYDSNRMYYNFRWFYHYSGGQLTNFGVHYFDAIRWFTGKGAPKAVAALGGRYAGIQDNREIPDTMEVVWEYDDMLVSFLQVNANSAPASARNAEIEIRGTSGTMYVNYSSWEVVPELLSDAPTGYAGGKGYGNPLDRRGLQTQRRARIEPQSRKGPPGYDTESHVRDFLDCIKARRPCRADVEIGHISNSAPLIGNIAHRLRSFLQWDGQAERFTNNDRANQMLHYEYRAPYKLPV